MSKQCTRCWSTKELGEFSKAQNQCKVCRCEIERVKYKKRPPKNAMIAQFVARIKQLENERDCYKIHNEVLINEWKTISNSIPPHFPSTADLLVYRSGEDDLTVVKNY